MPVCSLLFTLICLVQSASGAPPAAAEWAQYARRADHNNAAEREHSIHHPRIAWRVAGAIGQPTLKDGYLYSGGRALYCIDARTGEVVAETGTNKQGLAFVAAPVLLDELVIARRVNGDVVAFDDELSRKLWSWRPRERKRVLSFPAALSAGLYIFTSGAELIALDARTGKPRWVARIDLGDPILMVPAVADGHVYVATKGGHVAAVDVEKGETVWVQHTRAEFGWTNPVVVDDLVFIGDRGIKEERNGALNAFDRATGKQVWSRPIDVKGISTPGVGDGFLVAGYGRLVSTFDHASGRILRRPRIKTSASAYGSPMVVGDALCFGNLDGHFYVHDLETGALKWAFEVPGSHVQDFVYSAERIYVSSSLGLFALEQNPERTSAPAGFVLTWEQE
jgi:outer membrane protein assembly factor BamB